MQFDIRPFHRVKATVQIGVRKLMPRFVRAPIYVKNLIEIPGSCILAKENRKVANSWVTLDTDIGSEEPCIRCRPVRLSAINCGSARWAQPLMQGVFPTNPQIGFEEDCVTLQTTLGTSLMKMVGSILALLLV